MLVYESSGDAKQTGVHSRALITDRSLCHGLIVSGAVEVQSMMRGYYSYYSNSEYTNQYNSTGYTFGAWTTIHS